MVWLVRFRHDFTQRAGLRAPVAVLNVESAESSSRCSHDFRDSSRKLSPHSQQGYQPEFVTFELFSSACGVDANDVAHIPKL